MRKLWVFGSNYSANTHLKDESNGWAQLTSKWANAELKLITIDHPTFNEIEDIILDNFHKFIDGDIVIVEVPLNDKQWDAYNEKFNSKRDMEWDLKNINRLVRWKQILNKSNVTFTSWFAREHNNEFENITDYSLGNELNKYWSPNGNKEFYTNVIKKSLRNEFNN